MGANEVVTLEVFTHLGCFHSGRCKIWLKFSTVISTSISHFCQSLFSPTKLISISSAEARKLNEGEVRHAQPSSFSLSHSGPLTQRVVRLKLPLSIKNHLCGTKLF